jgi:peptidylprolyl isomerase
MHSFTSHALLVILLLFAHVATATGSTQAASQAAQPGAAAAAAPAMPSAPPDVAAPPADAVKTASGLAFKVLEPGRDSTHPKPTDVVTLNYTGWTAEGRAFDSTTARGKPSTLPLERLMKGMIEGIQLMTVGEKRRFWIPEPIAFAGMAGRPKGMVVFDIELVGFEASPTAAPADVAAPPSDARRTRSGLAYKVVRPGSGNDHPHDRSRVTVHYTGWTTDGKMFDSSVTRGKPATFGLNQVIKGWTEGVQLMVAGEKARFWIPENLAYKGMSGPQGMLVFDIELIAIEPPQ